MKKTILLTGATDGIGLETAKSLVSLGHHVLLHGRSPEKLTNTKTLLGELSNNATVESHVADFSKMTDVEALAEAVLKNHDTLDVIINNAGVYGAPSALTEDGLDIRFAVNTIAPYLLTKRLLGNVPGSGRVVNLSSAAQSPVDIEAMAGRGIPSQKLSEGMAYAQSKLALTMWSRHMGLSLGDSGPVVVSVNPGSLLGSKMVKEAFGIPGGDLSVGSQILIRAAIDDEFNTATGQYFDNDSRQFASPHQDALDAKKCETVVLEIERILEKLGK